MILYGTSPVKHSDNHTLFRSLYPGLVTKGSLEVYRPTLLLEPDIVCTPLSTSPHPPS